MPGSAPSPEGRDKVSPAGHRDEQRARAQRYRCEAFPTCIVSASGADQSQTTKKRHHNHLVAQFNAETERGDGHKDGQSGCALGNAQQSASEAESVKQAEQEGRDQPHSSPAAFWVKHIGEGNEHNAAGDHRLDEI